MLGCSISILSSKDLPLVKVFICNYLLHSVMVENQGSLVCVCSFVWYVGFLLSKI